MLKKLLEGENIREVLLERGMNKSEILFNTISLLSKLAKDNLELKKFFEKWNLKTMDDVGHLDFDILFKIHRELEQIVN